ncbi:MAG: hypothetical protein IKX53_09980 [Bacteroidales bacterium]|nr:hypothetical protein [Bacteroidales bacterium]
MKRRYLFILLLLMIFPVSALAQKDPLARMNAVKRDTAAFLYGIGNMSTEKEAREEALLALSDQLKQFLSERPLAFVKDLESVPEGAIQFITYSRRANQFRVMAYIDKAGLTESDQKQVEIFEETSRNILEELVGKLAFVETQEGIAPLIEESGAGEYVHFGSVAPDTKQNYVDEGYLAYIDRKSGKILEMMTPRDGSGNRHNARTGALTSSMKYKRLPILWIYIEGQNKGSQR